ncbi:MAG: hypothetical protein VR67_03310 [Peptococcaceae bacterium BRH_c8a]|nr:MAG: hypothetical protein VR67_03310 [Peptococcaceae bacterium BRH_c8a]
MNNKNKTLYNSKDSEIMKTSLESLNESMAETLRMFSEVVSKSLNHITTAAQGITESIANIEFPQFFNQEAIQHIEFIMILRKIKWPLI